MTEPRDVTLYVLAGTYQQAQDAARAFPREQRWRYVSEPRHLFGVHGGAFVIVGTFWERRDAAELHDRALVAGLSSV